MRYTNDTIKDIPIFKNQTNEYNSAKLYSYDIKPLVRNYDFIVISFKANNIKNINCDFIGSIKAVKVGESINLTVDEINEKINDLNLSLDYYKNLLDKLKAT